MGDAPPGRGGQAKWWAAAATKALVAVGVLPECGEGVGVRSAAQGVGGLRGRVGSRGEDGDEDRDQDAGGLDRGAGGVQLGTGRLEACLVCAGQAQLLADTLGPTVRGQRGGERGHRLQGLVPAPVDALGIPGGAGGAVLDDPGDDRAEQRAEQAITVASMVIPPPGGR
ncbi:hypothetical protein [Streptomyces sp. NPDC047972]|uniref:hypothetical protein n=1 Tax=Streptomyces sp. NPDC047972 TaxID=3365493 RepID=UPI003714A2D8